MRQYCRYCNNMVCGDANYCSAKDRCYSDSYIRHANHCKDFEFNSLDAITMVYEYHPREEQTADYEQITMAEIIERSEDEKV